MDQQKARQLLGAERARLEGIRDDGTETHDQPKSERAPEGVEGDQRAADAATEVFDEQMQQSIVGHAEAELHEVEDALRRLDEGEYGRCQECGREIPDERLEAMPATRYCVEHQQVAEKRAGVGDASASGRASGDSTATTST